MPPWCLWSAVVFCFNVIHNVFFSAFQAEQKRKAILEAEKQKLLEVN